MIRITTFSNGDWRTVSFESFENNFLEICQAHRTQGRALAFAFILFDRSNPYVRSSLAHQHYWDALNERSGRYLSVFSLDARPPTTESTVEGHSRDKSAATHYTRIKSVLSQYFKGLDQAILPSVLFFQVADAQVIDRAFVTLAETDPATTYRELEKVIGIAADAVANVEDKNAQNAQEIFNLIIKALRDRQIKRGLMRLYHTAIPAGELVAVIELLKWLAQYLAH